MRVESPSKRGGESGSKLNGSIYSGSKERTNEYSTAPTFAPNILARRIGVVTMKATVEGARASPISSCSKRCACFPNGRNDAPLSV